MRVENRRNSKTIILIGITVVVVIIAITAGLVSSCGARREKERDDRLEIPFSSDSIIGENYQDVQLQLEEAGFTNIIAEDSEKLILGIKHKEGEVKEVSVNGKTSFSSTTRFSPDVKIVIRYYSFGKSSEDVPVEERPVVVTEEPKEDSEKVETSSTTPAVQTVDWRQWLLDYEKWMDSYIAFLVKYYENPNDISLLADSLKMLEESEKWAAKYEEIEPKLTDAELQEYTKEYLRILQKYTDAILKFQ